jgi:hypothetical protein
MWPTVAPSGEYQIGSPAPPANDGMEGNQHHWNRIARIAARLRAQGYRDIRVNQEQVGGGRIVGTNRPDIQAVGPDGRRLIVEVDTNLDQSLMHQDQIRAGLGRTRDGVPTRSVFITIDPVSGRVTGSRQMCHRCGLRRP